MFTSPPDINLKSSDVPAQPIYKTPDQSNGYPITPVTEKNNTDLSKKSNILV